MTVKIDGTNTVANPAFTGADTDTGLQCGTNELKLVTGGSEAVTVDSSQNVGVGKSSPDYNLDVEADDAYVAQFTQTNTSSAQGGINIVSNQGRGDLGNWNAISINGNDNVSYDSRISWSFDSIAEGPAIGGKRTSSSGTDLIFYTTESEALAEKLRIASSGRVGIGTSDIDGQLEVRSSGALGIISRATSTQSTDGNKALRVRNNSDTDTFSVSYKGNIEVGGDGSGFAPGIELSNYTGDGSTIRSKRGLMIEADYDNNSGTGQSYIGFKTDGTEHLRIDAAGHILYNQFSSATPGFNNTTIGLAVEHLSSGAALFVSRTDSLPFCVNRNSNGTVVDLRRSGSQKGNIQVTTTTATFNSASDYRLKENVVALSDGITRLKQLNPSRFNFIEEPDTTVDGFIAHEAQAVVPEAVTGTHNEVDDDGNPVMQGMDYGKVTPLLTAALQEAIAKIETLETQNADLLARVTALENA